MQELTERIGKMFAVTRLLWNDFHECRAECIGSFTGNIFSGSFITYVCDKPAGHDQDGFDEHYDSHMLTHWESTAMEVGS